MDRESIIINTSNKSDYERKNIFVSSGDRNFRDYANPMDFKVDPISGFDHESSTGMEKAYVRCDWASLPSGTLSDTGRTLSTTPVETDITSANTATQVGINIAAETYTGGTVAVPTTRVSIINTSPGIVAAIDGATFVSKAGGSIHTAQNGADKLPQISIITTVAEGSTYTTSGAGDYFRIFTPSRNYFVWFDIANGNTRPAVGGTAIEVDVAAIDSAATIASAINTALASKAGINASVTNLVDFTNTTTGAVDSPDGGTYTSHKNRAIAITTKGVAGTAQVVTVITADGSTFSEEGVGDYFVITSTSTTHYFWFDVSSGNTEPAAIRLAAASSSTQDYYNGYTINISGGTGAGQTRCITDYNKDTKIAVVDRSWGTQPTSASAYIIQTILSYSYVVLDVTFHNVPIRGVKSFNDLLNTKASFILPLDHSREASTDTPFVFSSRETRYEKTVMYYNHGMSVRVLDPAGKVITVITDIETKPSCKQASFNFEIVPVRAVDGSGYGVPYGPARLSKGGQSRTGKNTY